LRARIRKELGCYVGEVYGKAITSYFGFDLGETIGWVPVTPKCITYLGARLALFHWKKVNQEFEL